MTNPYPGSNEPYPNQPPPPPPSYAPPPPSYAPPSPMSGQLSGAPMAAGYVPEVTGGNSGLAITSMVLSLVGLVGFCPFLLGIPAALSVAGVICGHIALNQINKSNNTIGGKGMALTGLILGYLEIAAIVIMYVFFASLFTSVLNQPTQ